MRFKERMSNEIMEEELLVWEKKNEKQKENIFSSKQQPKI